MSRFIFFFCVFLLIACTSTIASEGSMGVDWLTLLAGGVIGFIANRTAKRSEKNDDVIERLARIEEQIKTLRADLDLIKTAKR